MAGDEGQSASGKKWSPAIHLKFADFWTRQWGVPYFLDQQMQTEQWYLLDGHCRGRIIHPACHNTRKLSVKVACLAQIKGVLLGINIYLYLLRRSIILK